VRDAIQGGPPEILSPGEAADIPCREAPPPDVVAAALGSAKIDAIATRARGRRKGLLVADMDSTIVTSETLDEIAAFAGLKERIAAITARSMNGEIDFATALRERVAMLKGLAVDALEKTWANTRLTPGARELVATMKAHNATTALVSGGFTAFTARIAATLGFHEDRANTLVIEGGKLAGRVAEPILGKQAKLDALNATPAVRRAEGGPVPGYAAGGAPITLRPGLIRGPGTGTSDSILARVSAGEHAFITKASRARQLWPLLNALNFGSDALVGRVLASLPGGLARAPAPVAASGGYASGGAVSAPVDTVNINLTVGRSTVQLHGARDQANALAGALRELQRGL
jgi:phosphoserine phosphatase